VGEHRDFKLLSGIRSHTHTLHTKFDVRVDHRKSKPMDDELFLKWLWSRHITHFKFLVPLKYLWNGLS